MKPALAHRLDEEPIRGFLTVALACDQPERSALVAAGIADYRARELLDRLHQAGEISHAGWHPEARTAYLALLDTAGAPSRPTGRLHQLPDHEKPREKARERGVGVLGDAELLAVLLRTGGKEGVLEMAERLLADHDGLIGLAEQEVDELAEIHGLGEAKAAELAAAFELGRRLALARRRERPPLKTPETVVALLREDLVARSEESFFCLPLDARSRLIGRPLQISLGDVDGTDAGPRAFFRAALKAGAVAAIAVHNHPSGDARPSGADLTVTRRLAQAGRLVEVTLEDHLIIGDGGRSISLRRERPDLFS